MKNFRFVDTLSGFLLILIYVFGIAFKGPFAKLAYQDGSSTLSILLWRFLLSVPIFWLIAWLRIGSRQLFSTTQKEFVRSFFTGIIFYVFVYCDYYGLSLVSVSIERIILFTYPVFVILFNFLVNGRIPLKNQILALVLVQLGIAALVLPGLHLSHGDLVGQLWVFVSALFLAAYLVLMQRYAAQIGTLKFTAHTMSYCLAALMIHFLLSESFSRLQVSAQSFLYIVEMVVFSIVLPTLCLAAGITKIGANRTSIISTIGPFITIVCAHFIFGDRIENHQIAAALIICFGITLLERSPQKAKE